LERGKALFQKKKKKKKKGKKEGYITNLEKTLGVNRLEENSRFQRYANAPAQEWGGYGTFETGKTKGREPVVRGGGNN